MLLKKINENNLKVNVKVVDDLVKILENEDMKDSVKLSRLSNMVNRMVEALKEGSQKRVKTLSKYQEFMKKNYPVFRQQMVDQFGRDPDPKDIMKYGAEQWKKHSHTLSA